MPFFEANDNTNIHYKTYGPEAGRPLILLHGFTGSGAVWNRNVDELSATHYVVVPDIRGHGRSDIPKSGYHVARLAMDLKNLIEHLKLDAGTISVIGASLGAAIIWSYCELFGAKDFKNLIWVDQSPLQNYVPGDWGPDVGNRGLNSPEALSAFQKQLMDDPKAAHLGTINACLAYRYASNPGDYTKDSPEWQADEEFFLAEATKGDPWWYGKLMADHTALDWRDSIKKNFNEDYSRTEKPFRTLAIASDRSGCFPAAGPLYAAGLAGGGGQTIGWGGHWCYWEQPKLFNREVLEFLQRSG